MKYLILNIESIKDFYLVIEKIKRLNNKENLYQAVIDRNKWIDTTRKYSALINCIYTERIQPNITYYLLKSYTQIYIQDFLELNEHKYVGKRLPILVNI
jgi:hypothetical protein